MKVVAFIGISCLILIFTIASALFFSSDRALKYQVAQVQIDIFEESLSMYYDDMGEFPSSSSGLQNLLINKMRSNKWQGPYLR
jgi:type II secretory pathway pseudopilin PulG